jgi:hypothetical protein
MDAGSTWTVCSRSATIEVETSIIKVHSPNVRDPWARRPGRWVDYDRVAPIAAASVLLLRVQLFLELFDSLLPLGLLVLYRG